MKNQSSCLLYLIIFLIIDTVSAQTLNFQTIPTDKMQFGFSFDKPFYSHSINPSTLSGVYQLSLNIPVSSKLNIIGEVPFIINSYEADYGFYNYKYDENGFGNIFIGFQTNRNPFETKRSIVTFGLYLPTADEKAAFNGLSADYYNLQKFFPHYFGIYFNYAFHDLNPEGFNFGLEAGPNIIFPTEGTGAKHRTLCALWIECRISVR